MRVHKHADGASRVSAITRQQLTRLTSFTSDDEASQDGAKGDASTHDRPIISLPLSVCCTIDDPVRPSAKKGYMAFNEWGDSCP